MKLRETFQILLKNWVLKQLTAENVRAILTAGIAQLRIATNETENKVDDYVLDFLESIVLDPVKIETVTDFIRSRLAGTYGDVPPACDGPVNNPYECLASNLTSEGTYCTGLGLIIKLGGLLAEIVPLLVEFFKKEK